ncbi:hypothetical protein AAHK14_03825 [Moraxella sp. K1664]|uniref:Uncharacterized protein n=1 Tax=Moraxella lacunata TaxID=477 RepID=A0A1B8Q4U1_MORLA|nr:MULTISPECIES: hypothetical protein [Moraxella]MBE9577844.1 hypothetical protein [Moraxella sp. K1664]MDH9218126.1 hypothetical protein [Moraxella lacunata]MDI4481883.1 hypothetical protein [Moraxella lacunata]MDI4506491.1 hypothetical protein [Moraxella lacunata]OBX64399.1 hypothetical protein A9Z63_03295 [Moraxella lacunata]
MAYCTGQANSHRQLANILVEKCQVHGWVWQQGILSKNNWFIKISVQENPMSNQGIIITGGTGQQGATLVNASATSVRMGSPHTSELLIKFPVLFHLFIFENEVYLIAKSDHDKYYYLAFGGSELVNQAQANGLWLSATACYHGYWSQSISIYETNGGAGGGGNPSAVAPFWNRSGFSENWSNAVICHGLNDTLWSSGSSIAYATFEPLISRLPTAHFADSPLLPYNVYLQRPQNKLSLIAQFDNARFLRIDNHEPEQIITLGHERWMIFPFFRKNIASRSRGYGNHTGTFGWAIRYEG